VHAFPPVLLPGFLASNCRLINTAIGYNSGLYPVKGGCRGPIMQVLIRRSANMLGDSCSTRGVHYRGIIYAAEQRLRRRARCVRNEMCVYLDTRSTDYRAMQCRRQFSFPSTHTDAGRCHIKMSPA